MFYFQFASSILDFLRKRKSLFLKIFAATFTLWLITLALAPVILSRSQLFQRQLNQYLHGSVTIKKTRLSWFKSQTFEGITLNDSSQNPILTIQSLKTNASLISLLRQKLDFKEVYIDGLIGNIVNTRGKPSTLTESLNAPSLISQENNPNRITPIYIFKKPIFGNFHVDNSSFLIQSHEHPPIYFNDLQLQCAITDTKQPLVAQIACETAQNDLSGSVHIKLEMGGFDDKGQLIFTPLDREIFFLSPDGYMNVSAKVTNLPSAGIDHLFKLFNPQFGQIFSHATGGAITIKGDLHVVNQQSKLHLAAHSSDLNLEFAGALRQNQFFLTQPSICSLNIHPSLIRNIAQFISPKSQLTTDDTSNLLIQMDRFSTPLDLSDFNFKNLSCNARFSLAPMRFIDSSKFNHFEIKQIEGSIDTFDLNENLSFHLKGSALDAQKPVHLVLNGELKKLIDEQQEFIGLGQVHAHFVAQTKNLPTKMALLLLKKGGITQEILGPHLNADLNFKGTLEAAKLGLNITSSRLNIENMLLKMHENFQFTLTSPTTLKLRATPKLTQQLIADKLSILHPFELQGELQKLNISFQNKLLHLHLIDLTLSAAPFEAIFSHYKPCHIAQTQAQFTTDASETVSLSLFSCINLPNDLKTFSLDRLVKAQLQLTDFLGYIRGKSSFLQTSLKSSNWQTQLNGYLHKHGHYQLLQEAEILFQNIDFKWRNHQFELPSVVAHLTPCQLNLANLQLKDLLVSGRLLLPEMTITAPKAKQTFYELKIPFNFSGPKNTFQIEAASQRIIQALSLNCSNFLDNHKLSIQNTISDLNLQLHRAPASLLNLFAEQKFDGSQLIGSHLNLNLSAKCELMPTLQGHLNYTLDSPTLKTKGAFVIQDNILQNQDNLQFDYILAPTSYVALRQIFQKNFCSHFLLEEPLNLKATMHQLCIPLTHTNSDSKFAFNGHFSIDKMVTSAGNLRDVVGSFDSSDLERNLKLDLSGTTQYQSCHGNLFLSAALTDSFSLKNRTLNPGINGHFQCALSHFPAAIASDFIPINIELQQLLGPTLHLKSFSELQSGEGPLQFELQTQHISTQLALQLSKNHLTLNEDLYIQVSPPLQTTTKCLSLISPLFAHAEITPNHPLSISIPKQCLSLQTAPFTLQNLEIEKATIAAKSVTFTQSPTLSKLFKFLNDSPEKTITNWLTPIDFSLKNGNLHIKRVDCILAGKHHVALWGDYNLLSDTLTMQLAIPAQTLAKNFNLKSLPENYFFQIPLTGLSNNLKVDWPTAIAQLCLLSSTDQLSDSVKIPLQQLFEKSQPCSDLPQRRFDLPRPTPVQKSNQKKTNLTLTDKEQSKQLHSFLDKFQKAFNN